MFVHYNVWCILSRHSFEWVHSECYLDPLLDEGWVRHKWGYLDVLNGLWLLQTKDLIFLLGWPVRSASSFSDNTQQNTPGFCVCYWWFNLVSHQHIYCTNIVFKFICYLKCILFCLEIKLLLLPPLLLLFITRRHTRDWLVRSFTMSCLCNREVKRYVLCRHKGTHVNFQ